MSQTCRSTLLATPFLIGHRKLVESVSARSVGFRSHSTSWHFQTKLANDRPIALYRITFLNEYYG
jgi:hypothetical protein